jgi:predicted transcriptional regulator
MEYQFVNRNKLKGLIVEHTMTQNEFAEKMGISISSFNLKINGHYTFNEDEILFIYRTFGLEAFYLQSPVIKNETKGA